MKGRPVKNHPTIGCCGLDCGLCPRYYTVGTSQCPGCCGSDFFEKHPSCGYITCCVKEKGLEVCGQCAEFPCGRFDPWLESCEEHDSFVTHRKVAANLDFVRAQGVEKFLEQQGKRIGLLERMIRDFDDGRSRNLYCIATTVLPIADLEGIVRRVQETARAERIGDDVKARAKKLKAILNEAATQQGIELKLKKG